MIPGLGLPNAQEKIKNLSQESREMLLNFRIINLQEQDKQEKDELKKIISD